MLNFSIKSFTEHIRSDNAESSAIYNDLKKAFYLSLSTYPKNQNIIGVYFFDILKLITNTHFKNKELQLGIEPTNKFVHRKLDNWPYIGYEDITQGIDLKTKNFGKIISIKPSITRRILQHMTNFQCNLGSRFSKTVSLTSLRISNDENLLSFQPPQLKRKLISAKKGWFSVPNLSSQLDLLRSIIIEVMETNNHPLSPVLISEILLCHINADCYEGSINFEFTSDVVVLNSGVDLHNRMLGMAAINQGLPVINIQHGEAYGIFDEPPFGELGECIYSSAVLGYGDGALANQQTYKFGLDKKIHYIKSNSTKINKLFSNEFKGLDTNTKDINYFYFPTSLGGASHRYGPYRDTSDSLYLSWQLCLINIFNGEVTIKSHPKEKYLESYNFKKFKSETGTISELLQKIDVFIFDYVGTAFNEACATEKPIIYFDLGIRNIAPDVLKEIKKRTIYFDIENGLPTIDEIKDHLYFSEVKNSYSKEYSLCGNDKSRIQSLSDGIDKLYG